MKRIALIVLAWLAVGSAGMAQRSISEVSDTAEIGWETLGDLIPTADGVLLWENEAGTDGSGVLQLGSLRVLDSNASHYLTIDWTSNDTSNRLLNLVMTADRTVTVSGDATISQDYSTTGSPTFATPIVTSMEVGHATQNTLTGSSGNLSVEGNVIYRAGGTDVPVTDGGTGASTVAGAQASLDFPRVLVSNITPVGNVGVGEDNLMTYSLPANTLAANGDAVRVTAQFTSAVSVTGKVYFAGTAIASVAFDGALVVKAEIVRIDSDSVHVSAEWIDGDGTPGASIQQINSLTFSNALDIKGTGTGTSNDDITQKWQQVNFEVSP